MEHLHQEPTLITEGKTKKIFAIPGDDARVRIAYKNDITAFDNPAFTQQFETKAAHSNTTNAGAFALLNAAGIPTAFVQKTSATEFVALKCAMVPLEVVARRYAVGSYLKRAPEYEKPAGEMPHQFGNTVVEFFLKTTKGGLSDRAGNTLIDGLDPLKGEEDPFIPNPFDPAWHLAHPKKQAHEASLHKTIEASRVASPAHMHEMAELTQKAFAELETFFAKYNFKFIDFKIEFGIVTSPDGTERLVIADVIDNDSWRLRDRNWNDVSKQSFRDGEALASVEDKYALVAKLFE